MKLTSAIGTLRRTASITGTVCLLTLATHWAAATDLNSIFEQGKAAFYRGDYATAERLLLVVAKADPRHGPTKALLWQINDAKPKGQTLQQQYAAVRLPKVEITDATLSECLQALTIISRNATDGKLQPNFILLAQDKANSKVTLTLTDIPLTEAINYVTQLSGTTTKWDKNAVIIANPGQ